MWKTLQCLVQLWRTESDDLLHADQVPLDLKEPWIPTGYRPLYKPWGYYFRSFFYFHNESINVWTHFAGQGVVLLVLVDLLSHFHMATDNIAWPILVFGLSCISQLFLSTIAHLLHSKSPWHHHILFMLDYAGVTIMAFGTGIAGLFICCSKDFRSRWEGSYLPVLAFTACLAFFAVCMARAAITANGTKRKLMILGGFGLQCFFTGLPPSMRYLDCLQAPDCSLASLQHISLPILFLPLCAGVFASHAPERWFPGRFDKVGHSHQLFHVFTLVQILLQCNGIRKDALQLQKEGVEIRTSPVYVCLAFVSVLVGEALTLLYIVTHILHNKDAYQPKDVKKIS